MSSRAEVESQSFIPQFESNQRGASNYMRRLLSLAIPPLIAVAVVAVIVSHVMRKWAIVAVFAPALGEESAGAPLAGVAVVGSKSTIIRSAAVVGSEVVPSTTIVVVIVGSERRVVIRLEPLVSKATPTAAASLMGILAVIPLSAFALLKELARGFRSFVAIKGRILLLVASSSSIGSILLHGITTTTKGRRVRSNAVVSSKGRWIASVPGSTKRRW